MPRGRPPKNDHDPCEFLQYAWALLVPHATGKPRFSWHGLAAAINALHPELKARHGDLGRMFRGERSFPLRYRIVVMELLDFPLEVRSHFSRRSTLPRYQLRSYEPEIASLDPIPCTQAELQLGLSLHIHGMYGHAISECLRQFNSAKASNNVMLQAEAANRLAALNFETDHFSEALRWCRESIESIRATCGAAALQEILLSIRGGRSALICRSDPTTRLLSNVLHLRSKVLVNLMVLNNGAQTDAAVEAAFEQSVIVADYLQAPDLLGHVRGWKAIFAVKKTPPREFEAERLLAEASGCFSHGSIGWYFLQRNQGIVYEQLGDREEAKDHLKTPQDGLPRFGDSRALSSTLDVLGDATWRRARSYSAMLKQRLQYALMAAVLHPQRLMTQKWRNVRSGNGIEALRAVEDLLNNKAPFDTVHAAMDVLARGRRSNSPISEAVPHRPGGPTTAHALIERNLLLVCGDLLDEIRGKRSWPPCGAL